jgi:hypothetical protein
VSVIASLWISTVLFSPKQLHSPCPALLHPLLYTVFHPRYCSLLSSRESSIRADSHSSILHSSNVTHQMSESPQPFNHHIAPSPILPLHRSLTHSTFASLPHPFYPCIDPSPILPLHRSLTHSTLASLPLLTDHRCNAQHGHDQPSRSFSAPRNGEIRQRIRHSCFRALSSRYTHATHFSTHTRTTTTDIGVHINTIHIS